MSAKNQSESTAVVQEEAANDEMDKNSEVMEEEGVVSEIKPSALDDTTSDRAAASVAEDAEAADDKHEAAAASEFNVSDKRRFTVDYETASESGADDPDAFEIDLDQIRLDSEEVERELEELRAKLKETENRLMESETRRDEAIKTSEDYADRFRKAQLQLRAETEEMRARLQRTFEQRLELSRGDIVAGLLDTLDNLLRAVVAADTASEQGAAFESLRDGVRATAEMFENQLNKLGLQTIVSEGETFNPEIHDAVELAIVPKEQDNVVLAELQRGYKFGDRLLRPARVKVGRAE